MSRINLVFLLTACVTIVPIPTQSFAQTEPVMYFCERYDEYEGEVGIGDRFAKGAVTIMVRSDLPMNLTKVTIRYDKYNFRNNRFEYYKKSYFDTERELNYLKFIMDNENNMEFEHTGFYRVFLLDEDERLVASALLEIIE
jgi:hypothetical protein